MILAYDCSRQEKPLKYLKLKDVKDEEEALYEIGRFLEVNKLDRYHTLTYVDRRQEGVVTFAYGGMEMYDVFKKYIGYIRNCKFRDALSRELRGVREENISIAHNELIPIFFLLIKDECSFECKYKEEYQYHPIFFNQKEERKNEDANCLNLNTDSDFYGRYEHHWGASVASSEHFFRCPIRFSKCEKTTPLVDFGFGICKVWWYDEVESYYKDVFKREVGEIKCHSS